MKKLFLLAMVLGMLVAPALTQGVVEDDPQMQMVAGNVLCCCDTYQGMCCKWMPICTGFIPGCFCN
jgi:hypothetical protein